MSSSELLFVKISADDDRVRDVYEIIKACGQDMYENQGLVHWKTPYSMENILRDCTQQSVFVALMEDIAVATFMLAPDERGVMLSKLAVSPRHSGAGIGSACLRFAEQWCKELNISNMHLSVYDQSKKAIDFYLHNGYTVYADAPTRYFRVLLMEKTLA